MDMLTIESDWETFSDSSSSEDQEENDLSYGGQAQSILSHLEDSIGKIDEFLSFERSFLHGDVVYSLSDQSGQMGRVTNIDMLVDLENPQGKVLKNVNTQEILKFRSFSEGDHVIKGPWLGLVQRVIDKVTVLFDDGAKCEVNVFEREKLLPLTRDLLEDSQYPYYPGQRVKVKSSITSKSAQWLCGAWRDNQDEGTVCAVEAGLVYVNWLTSVLVDSNLDVIAPSCWQDSKSLTLLSCFSHAHWQLGDWCMLPVVYPGELVEKIFQGAPTSGLIKEHKMTRKLKSRLNSNGELFIVGKIKTRVNILWQNGEQSLGLDPKTLLPANVINIHEFWPMQFVLEKSVSDDPLEPSSQRWGVIQCVDAKEHTVKVQWKTVTISKQENLTENKMETVSAYELVEHPDFCYCLGDIVFKMVQIQLDDQAYKDCGKSVINSNVEAALRHRPSNIYQKELHDNFYLSCIGNVVGFIDGFVEVKWANGLLSKVAPYEIVRVDRIEGSRTSFVPDANSEEFTQEINGHGSLSSDHKETGLSNVNGSETCDKHPKDCGSSSLSQAAFGLLSSIKASLFHTIGVASHSSAISYAPTSVEGNEPEFQYQEKVSETCVLCKELHPMRKLQSTENRTPDQEVISDDKDFSFSSDSHEHDQFKQFNILCNCSDHHFFEERKDLALSQVKRSWMKKVQQEWSILEKNLPDTIFVRVFEQRMDLLRAAIVGAPGTPYHDGLFFFDICFPPEYPNEPPMVHYISGGLRLNPNLYESGNVCLSILNTWTGTGPEVWNPGASTVLQVLLSVQALVLNEKPYFNEAGYDQQIGRAEGERNSVSYNENAFLVSCKSMLYILKRPPKHFEALVEEHFSQRSQSILQSCRAYLEGAPLAFPFGCQKTVHEAMNGTSKGFKIMLAKLFPKLVDAFSDKGIDCSQFVQLQNNCFKL
ncbi:hypothetical protein QN277_006124 [Acacia crassicarpa]|uniref:E2 ubiquitin-conjugating enzyme n=1 Tax=Acacia crassicarpa TaxID=499986 RepID=A0AAE1IYJ6_9FABA|nr:hypothetical protein QN277_006124 [Acacia crassicarpa]